MDQPVVTGIPFGFYNKKEINCHFFLFGVKSLKVMLSGIIIPVSNYGTFNMGKNCNDNIS